MEVWTQLQAIADGRRRLAGPASLAHPFAKNKGWHRQNRRTAQQQQCAQHLGVYTRGGGLKSSVKPKASCRRDRRRWRGPFLAALPPEGAPGCRERGQAGAALRSCVALFPCLRRRAQGGIKGAITARSGRIKPAGVRITGPSPATCTNQSTGGSTEKKKKDK